MARECYVNNTVPLENWYLRRRANYLIVVIIIIIGIEQSKFITTENI